MAKMAPNRTKYRKAFKGSNSGLTKRGFKVNHGDYGMQILERGKITGKQIEACRVAVNRTLQRKGELHIKVFPSKPVSKKPAETRMGKGKGGVDHYVACVKPGKILFELAGVSRELAQQAFRKAAAKLPYPTRFVERLDTTV